MDADSTAHPHAHDLQVMDRAQPMSGRAAKPLCKPDDPPQVRFGQLSAMSVCGSAHPGFAWPLTPVSRAAERSNVRLACRWMQILPRAAARQAPACQLPLWDTCLQSRSRILKPRFVVRSPALHVQAGLTSAPASSDSIGVARADSQDGKEASLDASMSNTSPTDSYAVDSSSGLSELGQVSDKEQKFPAFVVADWFERPTADLYGNL